VIERQFRGIVPNAENAVSRYLAKQSSSGECADELRFLASHFHEIPTSALSDLDYSDLDSVLSHESLVITSEDALFDSISTLCLRQHFELLAHVRFEWLSPDRVRAFVDAGGSLTSGLWAAICARLVLPVDVSGLHGRLQDVCPFDPSAPLSGVLARLGADVVNVTASGTLYNDPEYEARQAANLTAESYWLSSPERDTWLCYEFKNKRIKPTHYSLRSRWDGSTNNNNPRHWDVEVFNDGVEWIVVDQRRDNAEQNAKNVVRSFAVGPCEYCKYIRMHNQGLSWAGKTNRVIAVSSSEIFGQVKDA
jgi:hypothetical protein